MAGEHNEARVLKDVATSQVDIGLVPSGALQEAEYQGIVNQGELRVLENMQGSTSDPAYPFPYTTMISAPNWGLSAMPWVPKHLKRAVRALFRISNQDERLPVVVV